MANDYDVIIIGAGGAGLAAAHGAAERGRKVLVLEAGERPGGSLALSGGVFYAAETSVQREAGITDSIERMYRFYMAVNQYRLPAPVIRRLCVEATPVFEWLRELGVRFAPSHLYKAGLDTVARGHRCLGLGAEIAEKLEGALGRHDNVEIVTHTRVTGLLRDAAGAVCGVEAAGEKLTAPAVIVATGGIGANLEMVARYLPRTAQYGDWVWYVGAPTNRGDGVDMALSVGATMTGQDTGSIMLTPGFGRDFEPYIPGWFLFVDHAGRRFADETSDYAVNSNLVRDLPGGECFALFDEAARLASRPAKVGEKDQSGAYPLASWTADRLAAQADAGRVIRAATLDELAARAGLHADRLAVTIAGYNASCAAGHDAQFGKAPDLLKPLTTPPFYAVRLRPTAIGVTGAGLRTDDQARVLDALDRPIPGLFAAGETVGGVHGELYVGSGGMIANAIVYGLIAGRNAAGANG